MRLNLGTLPSGDSYEDQYQGYMRVFYDIAHCTDDFVQVVHPPWSWVPLLHRLRCHWIEPHVTFAHCELVRRAMAAGNPDRTAVEVLCGFRPETTDALWKSDMQWELPPQRQPLHIPQNEFIVTTNGSFHRPEVLKYLRRLEKYTPEKKKVLLVPCAADKPYPSPMHEACLEMLPSDFYLMNATGVVGLVPQDLWPMMPHYDSGVPNEWRLFKIARNYFKLFEHERIVVYCDYYNQAIEAALQSINQLERTTFVLPVKFYYDYENLMEPGNLQKLSWALKQ
jgi:predicted RNA-binding protein